MMLVVPTDYGTFSVDVSDAFARFAGLSRALQARLLRALDAPALRSYAALLDWGDAAGARRAIEALAVAPKPVIAAFLQQLVNSLGPSTMTFRPAGTPPPAAPPDPWAGLAGGGLGPARDNATGTQFDPRTGQPVQPGAGDQTAAVISGALNRGVDTLGTYLREEGASHRAEVAANATVTAAQAQAQAAERVAQINADRDLALARIRAEMAAAGTSGGDTANLQAQMQQVIAAAQAQQQAVIQQLTAATSGLSTPAVGGWWATASTPTKVAVVGVPLAVVGLAAWWILRKK